MQSNNNLTKWRVCERRSWRKVSPLPVQQYVHINVCKCACRKNHIFYSYIDHTKCSVQVHYLLSKNYLISFVQFSTIKIYFPAIANSFLTLIMYLNRFLFYCKRKMHNICKYTIVEIYIYIIQGTKIVRYLNYILSGSKINFKNHVCGNVVICQRWNHWGDTVKSFECIFPRKKLRKLFLRRRVHTSFFERCMEEGQTIFDAAQIGGFPQISRSTLLLAYAPVFMLSHIKADKC